VRIRTTAAAVLLTFVLGLVAVAPAFAEEGPETATPTTVEAGTAETTTPATGTTEPAAGAGSGTTSAGSGETTDTNRWIAAAIFALGLLAVLIAYRFYDGWRQSYQRLALAALKTTGRFPNTTFNPVEQQQAGVNLLFDPGAAPATPVAPVISGPVAIALGEKASYSATVDDAPATACTWTIEPAEVATVDPKEGSSVTVTPTKEGAFTLTATVEGHPPAVINLAAVAKSSEGGVPLLGTGFAGFTAAIVAISLAAGLTVLNIVGSEAFIAFLGPVLGYFFAKGKDNAVAAAPSE
jgi:hypothetical protein